VIRLPIPAGQLLGEVIELPAEEARRALRVLRLEAGAVVQLFDGAGMQADAVLEVDGERVRARLVAPAVKAVSAGVVHIAQALAKGDKMELVLQKATELGAASIVPFASMRAVVKLEGDRAADKVERWRKIATEAARQCGRADTPEVADVTTLAGVLARPGVHGLLYEGETDVRLGAFLDAAGDRPVTLLIGPEGGFDPKEVAQARAAGAAIVGLGPRILRTETVALAVLAIAMHRRGELG
jgi:16S rRNA (uracil1498-N3)-methyltransferase